MYVGIDVHKDYCYVAELGEKGDKGTRYEIPATIDEIERFASSLPEDSQVVMEACSFWEYIYDRIEPKVKKICLAHPLKTRVIAEARIKTDKIDAETLAKLLRADFLPESYVPPKGIRELRRLARHRINLGRVQTIIKNKVHGLLMRNGINLGLTDVFGKKGLNHLEKLELSAIDRVILTSLLNSYAAINKEIMTVTDHIANTVKENKEIEVLMSIPGIDFYSALIILSEIGDVKRFPNYKTLCAYSGLIPSTHQSGKTKWNGHITKEGNKWLRWILGQAVHQITRRDGKMRDFYLKLMKKKGKSVAKTACARKLLRVIYCMLTRGECYLEGKKQLLETKVSRMNRRAKEYKTPETKDITDRIEEFVISEKLLEFPLTRCDTT